tara:strand:- start:42933 stop:50264 length:7332 start_codon:yes stop_codon:yes gene_type:complete
MRAGIPELFAAFDRRDFIALESQIKSGAKINKLHEGMTLLDMAIIQDQANAVELLHKHGGVNNLSREALDTQRRKFMLAAKPKAEYKIQLTHSNSDRFELTIDEISLETGETVSHARIRKKELSKKSFSNGAVRMTKLNGESCVVIMDKGGSNRPLAVFRVLPEGGLEVINIEAQTSSFNLNCDDKISITGSVKASGLVLAANEVLSSDKATVTAKNINFNGCSTVVLDGTLLANKCNVTADGFTNNGVIRAITSLDVDCTAFFTQKGTLDVGKLGSIKTNCFENHQESTILSQEGELKIYGRSYLKNNGAIIARHLRLSGEHAIINYHGALIKAVSCIVPNKSNQFTNAGFYLIGRQHDNTGVDAVFNVATGITKLAGLFDLIPASPLNNIQTALAVSRAVYHGAGILNQAYQGNISEISSSELVHFFLDHILPSLGLIYGNEEKSNFVVAILYELWGAYLGEGDSIEQSIIVIEAIIRTGRTCAERSLDKETLDLLDNVLAKIKFTRNTIKYTGSAVNVAKNYYDANPYANRIAGDTVSAVVESVARDLLHEYELPTQIFGLEIEAKNLMFFFINRGHKQSKLDVFRQGTYGLINTLFVNGQITDEQKALFLATSQTLFSGKNWLDIHESYNKGQGKKSDILKQLFRNLTIFASYQATANQIAERKSRLIAEQLPPEENDIAPHAEKQSSDLEKNIEKTVLSDETLDTEPEQSRQESVITEKTIIIDESDLNTLTDFIALSDNPSDSESSLKLTQFIANIVDTHGADYCNQLYQDVYDKNLGLDEDSPEHAALSKFANQVITVINDKILDDYRAEYKPDNTKTDILYDLEAIYADLKASTPDANAAPEVIKEVDSQDSSDAIAAVETLQEQAETLLSDATDKLKQAYSHGIQPVHVDALHEVQRVIDGDYATNGHLGISSSSVYNHNTLDTVGTTRLSVVGGANYSLIRGTDDISILGEQSHFVTEQEHQFRDSLNLPESTSKFDNKIGGAISSETSINIKRFNEIDNHGAVSAKKDDTVVARKKTTNHKGATITGKNVFLEGTEEKSKNSGAIISQDVATLASKGEVEHDKEAVVSAKRVDFKAPEVKKSGALSAVLAAVTGYDSDRTDSVTWRAADDHLHMVSIGTEQAPDFDADAFNDVALTELAINNPDYDLSKLGIDSKFDKTLQVSLPYSERTISVDDLPQLDADADFVLNAPGSTLNATQSPDFEYQNNLRFKGEHFQHSGSTSLQQAYFDVAKFEDTSTDGSSSLKLDKDGLIQAEILLNQGKLQSDSTILWHVDKVANNAQTEEELNKYEHSEQFKMPDFNPDKVLVSNSGSIHANAHSGYIGQYDSVGGKLTSDDGGNLIYMGDINLKPILTNHGESILGYVAPKGMSWYIKNTWVNATIGSSGRTVLLGTGKLTSTGADIYGDDGCLVSFNTGIDDDGYEAAYYTKQEAKNKKDKTISPASDGYVLSHSSISSNDGQIVLASADSSIHMRNVTISTPSNALLAAKQEVGINGQEALRHESFTSKKQGLLGTRKTTSESTIVNVYSSNLFIGGQLKVNCLDFQLGAVNGVVGDVDITALTTILNGKQESFSNKTVSHSFDVSLPAQDLINVLSGHNAKAVFSTIVQNCGWDQNELEALANAESIAEIPSPLLNAAVNAWNLTALAATATNEWFDGSAADFVGTITDRLGLTTSTNGKRTLSTKVHFNWSKTTETTQQSSMVATNLYIGGKFKVFGNKLIISDGAQVDAKDLLLSLAKGIEMTKGISTLDYSSKTKKNGVGINVFDPKDVSVSAGRETTKVHQETATLAGLNGRETADIRCGEFIEGEGRITAKSGEVKASKISLKSAQSVYTESHKSTNINLSTNLAAPDVLDASSAGVQHSRTTIYETTTQKAGIQFDKGEGKLTANHIHLGQGAIIDAAQVIRADNQEGAPEVSGTSAVDHSLHSHKSLSLNATPIPAQPGGQVGYLNEQKTTAHNPSIYGLEKNVEGINTNRATESEVTQSKRKAFSLAAFVPNKEKFESEAQEIKQATNSVLEKGQKTLHYLFGSKPKQTDRLISIPAEADQAALLEGQKELKDNITGEQESVVQKDGLSIVHDTDALEAQEAESIITEQLGEIASEVQQEVSSRDALIKEIHDLPGVGIRLAGLSPQEYNQLVKIVEDAQAGVISDELKEILSPAKEIKPPNKFISFLKQISPIKDADAFAPAIPLVVQGVRIAVPFVLKELAKRGIIHIAGVTATTGGLVILNNELIAYEPGNASVDMTPADPLPNIFSGRPVDSWDIGTLQGTPPKEYDELLDKAHTGHAPEDLSWLNEPVGGAILDRPEGFDHTGHTTPDSDILTQSIMYRERADGEPWTTKSRIKEEELPIEGKVRFIPRKGYKPSMPLPKGPNNGVLDKFGNEWVKGPSRTHGEAFEWDVQLSRQGKQQLGWLSRDGNHLNVSLKGRVTHR